MLAEPPFRRCDDGEFRLPADEWRNLCRDDPGGPAAWFEEWAKEAAGVPETDRIEVVTVSTDVSLGAVDG